MKKGKKFGPIPEPERKRKWKKLIKREQRHTAGRHISMTRERRNQALTYEAMALAHLDFCGECDTLLEALTHLKVFA